MKYRYLIALAASVTGSAFAALSAPMPEFKNSKQLAEWRAEMAAEPAVTSTTEDPAFYTGKPYVASTGGYAFKYRSYNPELARWTSEDPGGFPDGANNTFYAPNPTSEIDFMGLMTLNTNGFEGRTSSYTPADPLGQQYRVKSENLTSLDGSSFTASMSGWNFAAGSSGATLKVINYTPIALTDKGVCKLQLAVENGPLNTSNYKWIQVITCNVSGESGQTGTFLDIGNGQTTPFYPGIASGGSFYYGPNRFYTQLQDVQGGGPIDWKADLYYTQFSGNSVTVLGGVSWKFSISLE